MKWKKDFIKYRREKAKQTLDDACYLLKGKRLFSAVNRIYYALFYEVSALLQVRDLSSPKHTGIKAEMYMKELEKCIDKEMTAK